MQKKMLPKLHLDFGTLLQYFLRLLLDFRPLFGHFLNSFLFGHLGFREPLEALDCIYPASYVRSFSNCPVLLQSKNLITADQEKTLHRTKKKEKKKRKNLSWPQKKGKQKNLLLRWVWYENKSKGKFFID